MKTKTHMTARCRCGGIEIETLGNPIVSTVCYCADCQEGSRQLEELPNAAAVRDADRGTAYILYRKDRFDYLENASLLKSYKIRPDSATNRVVATCCNSAMFMSFDKGPHWVSAYRKRFQGDLPPLEMRICTRSKSDGVAIPTDVPGYRGYPRD